MNKSMNEVLVRTIVKKAIRNLKIDPERTIRNLVDMAVQFADSRFQQEFYSCAQRILSNEHSGYYTLAKDSLSQVNEETLLNFSMNLGYNGLYLGAKNIREFRQREGYHIPWELYRDTMLVDSIISGTGHWIGFDIYGQLNTEQGVCHDPELNLRRHALAEILKRAFPLTKGTDQA